MRGIIISTDNRLDQFLFTNDFSLIQKQDFQKPEFSRRALLAGQACLSWLN